MAVGTGQALDLARRGDADVVFVHARSAEEKFLAEGHGVKRFPVMYNDFVLIGPKTDPAKIGGSGVVRWLPALLILLRSPFLFGYAKPVPVNFRALRNPRLGMVWVALAGPATNIALALVAAAARHRRTAAASHAL